jgi:putative membrane protein insertion efficiency factor
MILAWDLSRRPGSQWSAKVLLVGIDLYQGTLSSHMETAGVRCRFEPTCSHYAKAVIQRDGALEGSWRTLYRLARCGPWTPAGTLDQP